MTAQLATVQSALATLRTGPILTLPEGEPWASMIARISTPGQSAEIDEETYEYFLEVLPPRWMGQGFMFAEGGRKPPLLLEGEGAVLLPRADLGGDRSVLRGGGHPDPGLTRRSRSCSTRTALGASPRRGRPKK